MKVNEMFGPTTQGEGPYTGKPAYFIRGYGCVAPFCDFCDTKHSWKGNEYKEMEVDEIIYEVVSNFNRPNYKLVVITGGEPFIQKDIYELIQKLENRGYLVQIETSGKSKIDYDEVSAETKIVMSPKIYNGKFVVSDDETVKCADYYKFVVRDDNDIKLINEFVQKYKIDRNDVYLMPEGASRKEQLEKMPQIEKYCIENEYNVSIRLHVLNHDVKRGV